MLMKVEISKYYQFH